MAHSYCTTADVQARIGKIFTLTTTSQPSLAEVTEWIKEKSGDIDGALKRAGYATVPPTDEHDLLMLRGKVAEVVASLGTKVGTYTLDDSNTILARWDQYIRDLSRGILWLPGQTPVRNSVKMIRASVYK